MQVVLLIGATEYPLEEGHARWLEGLIRATSVDAAGQAWDLEASAALHVADVIAEDLERRHSPEPVELGRTNALGLLNAYHDGHIGDVHAHVARSQELAGLYLALRRFVVEAA